MSGNDVRRLVRMIADPIHESRNKSEESKRVRHSDNSWGVAGGVTPAVVEPPLLLKQLNSVPM